MSTFTYQTLKDIESILTKLIVKNDKPKIDVGKAPKYKKVKLTFDIGDVTTNADASADLLKVKTTSKNNTTEKLNYYRL